jgi:cytochrome c-type biogenesis protein CcmH
VTAFIFVCAAMVLVAVIWIAWPLLRPTPDVDAPATRTERRVTLMVLFVLLPLVAAGLYITLSTWKWDDPTIAQGLEVSEQLRDMQAHLREKPDDVEGWQLLGRSYMSIGQFKLAINAFERAYRLTEGRDPNTTTALAEALVLSDETAMEGRAGELFEAALAQAPAHPKALFYGSVAAMRAGKLELARDRLRGLLAQNPPQQIRPALERQIQDLESQIAGDVQPAAAPAAGRHRVKVAVTVAPAIHSQLSEPLTLFILARDPKAGGPPLAVERHTSRELPLTVELDEGDAMMPSRTIGSVGAVQIVARLSRSGTPQQQSGDYFGEASVQFDASKPIQEYSVNVTIDRRAP